MCIFAVVRFSRTGFHPSVNWTAGMVFLWSLLITLWFPWFADGSGNRLLFISLGKVDPHSMASSFLRDSASPNAPFSRIIQEYGRVVASNLMET